MVAQAGRGWRLAPCLVAMFEEADRRWPDRSTVSDGSIGDAAHAARKSGHNPNGRGLVLAGDLTDDKKAGCDADLAAEAARVRQDRRVDFMISNGRICSSRIHPWEWRPYAGSNPHDQHTHFEVREEFADDLSPWFSYADAPDPLPVPPLDLPRRTVDTTTDPGGVLHTVMVGSDHKVYKMHGDPRTAKLEQLGGQVKAVSVAFDGDGVCWVVGQGLNDDGLYVTRWTGQGWAAWEKHPGAKLAG